MSQDFAKKASKNNVNKKRKAQHARKIQDQPRLPGWMMFLAGVIFTLFAQLLYHLAQIPSGNDTKSSTQQEPSTTDDIQKPIIEFYEKLKSQEVEVPDDVVETRAESEYHYVLQAGSFRGKDEASQQRAEIILLGLEATIEETENQSGKWHRVIVGPFTSRSDLNKARSVLINNNMPSMKVKRDS